LVFHQEVDNPTHFEFAIIKVLICDHKMNAHNGGFHVIAGISKYFMMTHKRGINLKNWILTGIKMGNI